MYIPVPDSNTIKFKRRGCIAEPGDSTGSTTRLAMADNSRTDLSFEFEIVHEVAIAYSWPTTNPNPMGDIWIEGDACIDLNALAASELHSVKFERELFGSKPALRPSTTKQCQEQERVAFSPLNNALGYDIAVRITD